MIDVMPRTADPGAIWRVINGLSTYFATVAAVELGVFDALSCGSRDTAALAAEVGAAPGRLAVLCDALVGEGLLERRGDEYTLTVDSDTFLVNARPRSMRDLVLHSPGPWENWPALTDTVRGGSPPTVVDEEFYRMLVRATYPTQHAAAARLAEAMGPVEWVCDLGAGAAPWTVAFLEASCGARAVVNDLAGVAALAAEAVDAAGLTERCAMLLGDYCVVPLPEAFFDVVILAHVLRAEGPARARHLVARAARALRPGGRIVVADYFVADDRCGPRNALLLGVTMMSATEAGTTYTYTDFRSWFADAGLGDVEICRPVPFQEVMIAHKTGGVR